jgi:hypothetical protein
MLRSLTRMYWNRLLCQLGRRPRLGSRGYADIYGRELEGGYYYLTSSDLPGFRATLSPGQLEDIGTLANAIQPALNAYLHAYTKAQNNADGQTKARISDAHLPRHGGDINLIAELCNP